MREVAGFGLVSRCMPWVSMLLFGVLLAGTGGCASRQNEATADVVAPSPAPEPAAAEKAPEQDAGKKPLPAFNEKGPKVPLVGGCRDLCSNAKSGFEGFMRALLLQQPPQDIAFIRFVDTSILVDNGTQLGTQWATWFTEGKLPERQGGIDAWVEQVKGRVGSKLPADVLEAALGSSVVMQRHSSNSVKFQMVVPSREGATNGSGWQVMMTRRGLEWLVSEIQDAP